MNKNELRYIHTLNRYIGGPISSMTKGMKQIEFMPYAINAVLSRLLVAAELNQSQLSELTNIANECITDIDSFGDSKDIATTDKLRQTLSNKATSSQDIEALLASLLPILSKRNNESSNRLVAKLINQDWQHIERLETGYQTLENTPNIELENPNSNGLNEQQQKNLIKKIQQHYDESDDLQIESCSVVIGGFSKQTILVDLINNKVLPSGIVIRLDRAESTTDKTVVNEFPLIELLYNKGIKVSKPWLVDEKGNVTGNPLIIVSKTAGSVIADGHNFFQKQNSNKLVTHLAQELAKIHAIPIEELPLSVPGREQTNSELMRADLTHLHDMWDTTERSSITIEAAFIWLFDNLDAVGTQRSLVHGDMRFQNIIVDNEEIRSILDWELATIGNPGFDLGYAYHHIIQLANWQTFIDAYVSAGGITPADTTLRFYALRTELFALIHLMQLETDFLSGAFDKIDLIYAGSHLGQHNMFLLAKRLSSILNNETL